ncbi:AfsR/SARP family transcriptional regulator [Streptomyces sp. NPDC052236]|uniref:AfsR/SARP family transcriptional regulator n=1 Tax=Streptomyces sp. NPDC052236 TaxID=3365686 RepID=UPI0037D8E155
MRVQVLGPVCAWRDGVRIGLGSAGQRATLGVLALACGRPVQRAGLVDALWGERPPRSATNVIQTHVKNLRHLLEPDRPARAPSTVLPAVGDGYALRVPGDDLDLRHFRRLVAEAGRAQREGDWPQAVALLDSALHLWQAPALADVPLLHAHPKVVSLREERRATLIRYGAAKIEVGDAADAMAVLREAAAGQPLDEAVQALLMRAYQAVGRRAQAFAHYQDVRRRLADELGVGPGPDLAAAHAALLRESPGHPGGHSGAGPKAAPAPPASVARPVPAQLPADVAGFTGRAEELSRLDGAAGEGTAGEGAVPMAITVVSGTAGVGKTALAVHWAHRVRSRFPDGQLYVDLRGYHPELPLAPGEALTRFLGTLGVPGPAIPVDVDERSARYRTEIADRRMLVILDNAASAEQVRPLMPGTPSCAVIVTSRDSLPGLVALHGARRLELAGLPASDALALLRTLIGRRVEAEPAASAALTEQCARLPLVLRVAAELATARSAVSLSALVAELVDHQRRLELLDAGGDERAAVRTVFSWSYRHLPADAARTFRLLGLHPGPDIDPYATAALTGTQPDQARRALELLSRAHLLQRTGADRFSMHDLLRAYAADRTRGEDSEDSEADRQTAVTGLFDYYLAATAAAMNVLHPGEAPHRSRALPSVNFLPQPASPAAARAWLESEWFTLASVCADAAAGGHPSHATRLATSLFRYLDGGHHTEALVIHTHALQAARRIGDPTAQAEAQTNLGAVHWRLGRYEAATDCLGRALSIFGATGDAAGQARALSNLGNVCWRQGKYEVAADHHTRALALYRGIDDAVGQARTLTNLANILQRQGKYEDATAHHHQALALHDTTGDLAGQARTLTNLGIILVRQGQYEEAADRHRHALTLFRRLGHRGGEAYARTNLGNALLRQGRRKEATDQHHQALTMFRETGEQHGEACALNGLGEALHDAGRPAEALARHTAAATIALRIGERDEQARAFGGAALCHHAMGDPRQARHHWRLALALYSELGSPESESIRALLTSLGDADARTVPGPRLDLHRDAPA